MVIVICYGSNVFAAEALLGWNPNSETDLAGYKVYYGTSPENYSVAIDVGQTNTPSAPQYSLNNLADGTTFYFAVTAYNTSSNESGFSNEVSKTTLPVISGITSSNLTGSGAVITWSTNEPATSHVGYGTTTDYGLSTTLDSTLVTSHSVALTGLAASTPYHYRVKSTDASGNTAVSGDNTFTTPAAQVTGIDSSPLISGGCGMVFPRDGNSSGPGQAGDMILLLTITLLGLLRSKIGRMSFGWLPYPEKRLDSKAHARYL
jgi:hypothetical protein